MSKKRLTDWFQPHVKPIHTGVYETTGGLGKSGYQHWDGRRWGFWGYDASDAERCKRDKSCFQNVQWRGLAADPSSKANAASGRAQRTNNNEGEGNG